jgi:type IV secretion system protein VirB9
MKQAATFLIFLIISLSFTQAYAAKEPRNGRLDSRVKHVEYREGQVYKVHAHYLQDSLIILSKDEEIIHVGAGDKIAWQITPIQNYISLKPILEKADTNLNILTKHVTTGVVRSYAFELNAGETHDINNKSATFQMKFSYPEDELNKRIIALALKTEREKAEVVIGRKTAAEDWNLEYSFSGDTDLVPVRTYDDGEFTFFQFPIGINRPAIFLVNDDGTESIVNFHERGKFTVVQRVGAQFILRDGSKATCIFNDTYQVRKTGTVLANATKPATIISNDE